MTNQFTELLSSIKNFERRLSNLEAFNQIKTIKDESGNIIVDSGGLNSVNNFRKGQVFNGSAGLNTTSTSFIDVSGSSFSSLVFPRSTHALVYLMGYGHNTEAITSNLNKSVEVRIVSVFLFL